MLRAVVFGWLLGSVASGCAGSAELRHFPRPVRLELFRIAPECRNPGPATADACRTAALILSEPDARAATDVYTRNWHRVAFDGSVASGPGGGSGGGGNCSSGDFGSCNGGSLGSGGGDAAAAIVVVLAVVIVVVVAVLVVNAAVEAAKRDAARRITTQALRAVYERSGDSWSFVMKAELDRIKFRDRSSYLRFVDAARPEP